MKNWISAQIELKWRNWNEKLTTVPDVRKYLSCSQQHFIIVFNIFVTWYNSETSFEDFLIIPNEYYIRF